MNSRNSVKSAVCRRIIDVAESHPVFTRKLSTKPTLRNSPYKASSRRRHQQPTSNC
ncbi:hypothetical protein ANCCAN_07840 [Ancylostoma caninum]|uniref:Uncharacterized protein n=1 Tax=Ancylostoma caninum TaxID=29170 RepID=A0A368GP76_ANCCA|nr:hypothetical protein ANCCAN_07840 [Ancylostoma caninum]